MLIHGLSIITHEFGQIRYPETPCIWNHVIVLWVWLLERSILALRHEPKISYGPSDLIPNPLVVSLYLWVRCRIAWCSREKYVRNRSVWNIRTHGRYVGSVSHDLVVGLLKVRAYTWVWLCGVCRKTRVNRIGCAPW
jgi:hypothetical protein